ncbi:hypothetical protein E5206_13630 [Arthrobacter sp. PAMC25564]|nr:hypothetical protein E5206_13630 [Arthrobacter sp. PAMC25564]
MASIPAWGRATGPMLHSRVCAVVTAGSCLAHLWFALGNQHGPWLSLLMLAMVAVCVPCSLHIWRHRRVSALRKVMVSASVMAALHAFLLLTAGPSGHSHTTTAAAAAGTATAAAGASLAIIAVEITTAMFAATVVARLRVRVG